MKDLRDNTVSALREISNNLDKDLLAQFKQTLFPGWGDEVENNQELLVKEAASAILANGISPDNGTYVSQKALAAIIHYIADMME